MLFVVGWKHGKGVSRVSLSPKPGQGVKVEESFNSFGGRLLFRQGDRLRESIVGEYTITYANGATTHGFVTEYFDVFRVCPQSPGSLTRDRVYEGPKYDHKSGTIQGEEKYENNCFVF